MNIACRLAVLGLCLFSFFVHAADAPIRVRFDESVRKEPYTGRVYLFTSANGVAVTVLPAR